MTTLHCRPPDARPTRIEIGAPAARELARLVREAFADRRAFLLADAAVAGEHPGAVPALDARQLTDGGERLKSFGVLEDTIRTMARARLDRRSVLVAVGGGTIGDLGGLAAALYLRGVRLAQVPTTLLAMVDSCVGGKTAINIAEGKNLAGALWPADVAWIDPQFLRSLPEAEFRSGLGEVLKAAIGLDAELFALCESAADRVLARDLGALEEVVARCLLAKIHIVEADANERGPRRKLNLGHTLGHALEAHAGFGVPHGVAVARGLHHVTDLGERLGTLERADAARTRALLSRYEFAAEPLPPPRELLPFVRGDKKVEGDLVHAVLPTGIGRCEVHAMTPAAFLADR